MYTSDYPIPISKKMFTALSALVVACSTSFPAFAAPSDSGGTFRGAAGPAATSQATPPLADDSLLVTLVPGSDVSAVKGYLANEANAQTLNETHINSENWSVLQVKGADREATLNKINSMKSTHGELAYVSRNYLAHKLGNPPPNDTFYSQQWPLAAQKWNVANNNFNIWFSKQHHTHITILADGCDPVYHHHELGHYIHQYNALNPNITPFPEYVHGSFATGGGEGDVDSSITGCLTNNGVDLAGSGSFNWQDHADLFMLRMTTTDSVSFANIYNAIAWAINHQNLRFGQGPVNLSYGTDFPNTPLWSDPTIQSMGKSLLNQGDILVISAGDTPGTYTGFPPGNTVVVQASDQNNKLFTQLTLVKNDPIAAPGSVQPAIIGGNFTTDFEGTSFSAPWVSSLIATLIAVNPKLTSKQAYNIILSVGQPINGAPYHVVIPAWSAAINAGKP